MELTNEFRVGVPVERAWDALTDLRAVAPCVPGAELDDVDVDVDVDGDGDGDGDEHRGVLTVKVGPVTTSFAGTARIVERDVDSRRAVLRAEGRDTRGQGTAEATITATFAPDGVNTRVSLVTDLAVTGRVAQFGRGVLADAGDTLLSEFVARLEESLRSAGTTASVAPTLDDDVAVPAPRRPVETSSTSYTAGPSTIETVPVSSFDQLDAVGGSLLRRIVPSFLGLVALAWLLRRRSR